VKTIPLPKAAELMGEDPQFMRWGLQQERQPFVNFGTAVRGKNRWAYRIYEKPFLNFLNGGAANDSS
jgi:hypothetical protein